MSCANDCLEPLSPLPEAFTGLSKQLSSDEFLRIDPEIFATQVQLFHLKYAQIWSPANDISLLLVSSHLPIPSHRNPLVFSTSSIHFLGGRVFSHILCGESVHNIEHRVAVLSQWIDVARILRENGDMVGFVAITMAVLSPPILRLRETWSSMPPDLIEKLKKSGGSAMRVLERRKLGVMSDDSSFRAVIPNGAGREYPCADAVPFFGDLLHCMDEAYASRDRNIDFQKMVQGLEAIQASLASWRTGWVDLNPHFDSSRQIDTREVEQIQSCLQFLNSNNQEPPSNNSVVYFEKSLACEPSYTGVYLQSHYHQKLPLSTGVNVPLIFTDIRASFSLFDRSDTLAISGTLNRKTTSPSSGLGPPGNSSNAYPTAAQSNQNLRPPTSHGQPQIRRTRSFPPTHPSGQTTGYDDLDFTTRERTAVLHGGDNAMLRAIRDVAGVDQQLFNSKDGELVLKAITDDDSVSRPTSVIETTSKRQSVVSRRFSQIHSANVSPRVSMNMESYSIPNTPLREGFDLDNPVSLLVVPKGGTLERLVDILVLGVEDFSKRMNRSDEENADKPQSLLRMNMDVFTITFFATFRR